MRARRLAKAPLVFRLALAGASIPTIFYVNLVWGLDGCEREPLVSS